MIRLFIFNVNFVFVYLRNNLNEGQLKMSQL